MTERRYVLGYQTFVAGFGDKVERRLAQHGRMVRAGGMTVAGIREGIIRAAEGHYGCDLGTSSELKP